MTVPSIEVRFGDRQWSFGAERDIWIGRSSDCDVWIDDPLVSRRHAVLRPGTDWVLEDGGSANGCFRGGTRVDNLAIRQPTTIRLSDPDTGPELSVRPGPRPAAVVLEATSASTATLVLRTVTIGRSSDCSMPLSDPLASRVHASVRLGAGAAEIQDLQSLNGTFVNGVRVDRADLRDGDVVSIGNHDLQYDGTALQPRSGRRSGAGGLAVRDVGLVLRGGKELLSAVSLDAGRGTLTAVIGPSGAGKSTLAGVITGNSRPTSGRVLFDGLDVHSRSELLRTRIGFVPQADVVHPGLTVAQALDYAARLRLPDDTSAAERLVQVNSVIGELGLTEHAGTRIDRLSGGQRKRASVALELLTEPTLLVLDEPTSGLDPALDQQVMSTLRALADRGRAVLVVTHSVAYLDVCDQVLLLAPGGKTAYLGDPAKLLATLGAESWPAAFARTAAEPSSVNDLFRRRTAPLKTIDAIQDDLANARPAKPSTLRQVATIASRQLRLIVADRGYATFLGVLPLVLSALALVVQGSGGLAEPSPGNAAAASQLLVILVVGACFMGAALTVRDLVGERQIYLRERAVGLLPRAYLIAKVAVYGAVSIVEATLLVVGIHLGAPFPDDGFISPTLDLLIPVALTTWCCACVGLLLSAAVRTAEQVMPSLVVFIMVQLVLCGGLVEMNGRIGLNQLSWLTPARWGFAAAGSAVDIRSLNPIAAADPLWEPTWAVFATSLGALLVLGTLAAVGTLVLVRPKQ